MNALAWGFLVNQYLVYHNPVFPVKSVTKEAFDHLITSDSKDINNIIKYLYKEMLLL